MAREATEERGDKFRRSAVDEQLSLVAAPGLIVDAQTLKLAQIIVISSCSKTQDEAWLLQICRVVCVDGRNARGGVRIADYKELDYREQHWLRFSLARVEHTR